MSDWTPRGSQVIGIRVSELGGALEERTATESGASLGLTAKRDLGRYYVALSASLPRFTEAEASLIVDALNGVLVETHTMTLLWANVKDAIRYQDLDAKWDVDGAALVARLEAFTFIQAVAVVDATERYWNLTTRGGGEDVNHSALLRQVGLIA